MATNKITGLSIPTTTPIADKNGSLTTPWLLWFNKLYERVGTNSALSNTELENITNKNTQDIDILNIKVEDNTNDIEILNIKVEDNTNDIEILKTKVADNTNDIDILNTKVADNTNDIDILNTKVADNTNDIDILNTKVADNTNDIATLNTKVADNTNDIDTLKSTVLKTITNVGSGISIWLSTLTNNANLKSIKAGTNVTLDNTTDPNTIIINATGGGSFVVQEGTGSGHNSSVVYSQNGLQVNTTGTKNSAVGYDVLLANTTGANNTSVGNGSLKTMTTGGSNTAIGVDCLGNNPIGSGNTAVGYQALFNTTYGPGSGLSVSNNTAVGYQALLNTKGGGNVAIGYQTMLGDSTSNGGANVAIGTQALFSNQSGANNVGLGYQGLYFNTTGGNNFGMGNGALFSNTTGNHNVGIGAAAVRENKTGNGNVGIGLSAGRPASGSSYATSIGYLAGSNTYWDNCTSIGNSSDCTATNQVQLGNSATTTYVYGTVQNRSDERDKADIRDSELGLDFIMALKPKQWKWNFRSDYEIQEVNENGDLITINLENDGSKTRKRFHNGFTAQDILEWMISNNIDFGGFQDHNITMGKDVLSLGYDEFISPIVKAIQEQQLIILELQKQIKELKK